VRRARVLAAAGVAALLVGPAAAAPVYCTGQRVTDEGGALLYPNGRRVVDSFGTEHLTAGRLDRGSIGAVCVSGR
jgi:hypothetical protein